MKEFLIALANGETLQRQLANSHHWHDLDQRDALYALYCGAAPNTLRIKTRTIRIGGRDVPEPLRVAPAKGTEYWAAVVEIHAFKWAGDPNDEWWLARGLIHATEEAARAHAEALIALSAQGGGV